MQNLSKGIKMGNTHKMEIIQRDYPYYLTNEKVYVKLVNDYQGWEKVSGKETWTNYGSTELCQQRLKDYKPCTREEYINAQ